MEEKLENILSDLQSLIYSEDAKDLDDRGLQELKVAWADIEWVKRRMGNK